MTDEIWKPIPGYESRYEASNLGRVRSVDHFVACGFEGKGRRLVKGRVLRPGPMASGHLSVALGKDNSVGVHICVMQAFEGAPPLGHEVLHLDHNPANNARTNLKYGTRGENIAMDYAAGVRTVHPNFIGARWRK